MPPTLPIVLAAVLFFLIALLALRIRIVLTVKDSVCLQLRILFLRFTLYPRRKKIKPRDYSPRRIAKKERRDKRKAAKKAAKLLKKKKKGKGTAAPKKKRTLPEKLRLARALLRMLIHRTKKHLRLHAARLHIRVATGDAATTAIAYGAVSQSAAYLLGALGEVTRLRADPDDVCVVADFTAERSTVDVRIILSIRIFGALATVLGVIFSYLRTKLGIKAARKKRTKQKTAKKGN